MPAFVLEILICPETTMLLLLY